MICFPCAKINIGLHVTGKRDDGYHNLETLFYPVPLVDILEIIPLSGKRTVRNIFNSTGIRFDENTETNLCLQAWKEMNKTEPLPPVNIHLHKIIPVGAGLGGGSSDAASALIALNDLFNINMNKTVLASLAAGIGSDCPFFIYNKPMFASGRGEVLQDTGIDLSGYKVVIVYPGKGISTAWAFSNIEIREHNSSLRDTLNNDPATWQGKVFNDFETVVFKSYPEISSLKEKLLDNGALYASLTGSGSAVYGLYDSGTATDHLRSVFPGMFFWEGKL